MKDELSKVSLEMIAQALASDYFCIYYVNVDNDRFTEYSASETYRSLGLAQSGDDFISFSREKFDLLIYPDDRELFLNAFTKEKVIAALDARGFFTLTFRLMFYGEPTYVHLKVTRMIEDEEHHIVVGISSVNEQMKRQKEYEKKMAEAKTNAKNDFLANMSHDIRTPMNAIIGYTNIAMDRQDDPDAVRDSLEKISSSSHFLLSLINDVLDISKIESGKMQINIGECDLAAVFRRIENITYLQAQSKSLIITYDHSSVKHCLVRGDEMRIEQVLINIVSNAIKYTPDGKTVELIAEEEPTAEADRHLYRFIVRDTGIGISEDYLPHIFDSFTREQSTLVNRTQGTGLGLAITAKVVELMGGKISVKSKLGEGSEFTVELELEEIKEQQEAAAEAEENSGVTLSGRKVLIVEDNDINAEIAMMVLSQNGVETERAENGQVGLDKVRTFGDGYFDAVLMDIQMPVMNGYEATEEIRKLPSDYCRKLPIIAMSANAYEEDVRKCMETGMDAHIAKPFQPEQLFELLKKMIR